MKPVALHHVERGRPDQPPVVLAGSLGTTAEMWDAQAAALADRHRVIAIDHRGHGRSPVPSGPYAVDDLGRDVLALLDRLGIERASWCGLSIGGMVGMWLAAHAPERIDRLVLICTSPYMPPASAWRDRAAAVRAAGTVAAVAPDVLARWLTPAYTRARPDVVGRLRRMLEETPPEGYAGCCEAIAAMDLRPDLASVAAPTLVVAGADDPAAPPEHGSAIADAIAGARLVVLPQAAHLASIERADEVTRLILDHLDPTERT